MAGIGFVLRKLSKSDDLSGVVQAFIYSTFISSGPWLFSVIALSIILSFGAEIIPFDGVRNFQLIIVYNFSFSFVIFGIFSLVITRFISDYIYNDNMEAIAGMMIGSLVLMYLIAVPLCYFFYFHIASFPSQIAFSAVLNFMIVIGVWHISVFLSTLKDYKTISFSFLIGMGFSVIAAFYLGEKFSTIGMLNGFSLGLCVILAVLFAQVFYEYPFLIKKPFAFLKYFPKYWQFFVAGLSYNIAVWVDKWIMWFSPEAMVSKSGLPYDLYYSSATFLGYLTIIPALGFFTFNIETKFNDKLMTFYCSIENKATLEQINYNHMDLIKSLFSSLMNFIVLQGSITLIIVLLASRLLDVLGMPTLQLGIFRYAVLGSFFQIFSVFFLILLYYFDHRNGAMMVNLVFLFSNTILTLISIKMGFSYYGIGFFLSSLITFVFSAIVTVHYLGNLPLHTFITRNKVSKF